LSFLLVSCLTKVCLAAWFFKRRYRNVGWGLAVFAIGGGGIAALLEVAELLRLHQFDGPPAVPIR
jgi:hypothetical protein